MARVEILKGFDTVFDGDKVSFAEGEANANITRKNIDDYNLVKKGLVALVKKVKPKGTE